MMAPEGYMSDQAVDICCIRKIARSPFLTLEARFFLNSSEFEVLRATASEACDLHGI